MGQVFNMGSREEITILDLAMKIKNMTDSLSEVVFVPYDQAYEEGFEDMPRRVPSLDKLEASIGYRPAFNLDQTLQRVIEFFSRI